MLANLDHFKRVNDNYGHQCGDHVLREVTHRLHSAIRTYDSLGRYGGEEFLMVFPNVAFDKSMSLLNRMREMIEAEPILWHENSLRVTCSFGAARMEQGMNVESLIHSADQALYQAKANGRNRIEFAGMAASDPIAQVL